MEEKIKTNKKLFHQFLIINTVHSIIKLKLWEIYYFERIIFPGLVKRLFVVDFWPLFQFLGLFIFGLIQILFLYFIRSHFPLIS